MIACVIEVGHPSGTPAVWRDGRGSATVCEHHKRQYDERPDLGPFRWERIAEVHCWEDGPRDASGVGSTCMLLDGHDEPHEFMPDDEITVRFE